MTRHRLVLVTTHPVQYQVPWIRGLAQHPDLDVHVLYGLLPDSRQQGVGFGIEFRWDVPLLDGYAWTCLKNRARRPRLGSWWGIHAPSVGAEIARLEPDAVLICGWNSRFLIEAVLACRRRGIPLLVRGESNALRRRPWWKRRLHRSFLSRFDAFLAIGTSNTQFYREAGVAPERIHWTPYAVDAALLVGPLATLRADRAAQRARFGVPADAVCFLFVGKFQPKKRLLDVLSALARARTSAPRAHLLAVGTGEQMDAARHLATAERLPVSFAGFLNQTELSAAYAVADCLVLPSDFGETWGLVVNEAMACGLPAIVSDRVGCGPDLVHDDRTGFRFPFGDVDALAALMVRVAGDPTGRERWGRAAQLLVAEYSIERAVVGSAAAVAAVLRDAPSAV